MGICFVSVFSFCVISAFWDVDIRCLHACMHTWKVWGVFVFGYFACVFWRLLLIKILYKEDLLSMETVSISNIKSIDFYFLLFSLFLSISSSQLLHLFQSLSFAFDIFLTHSLFMYFYFISLYFYLSFFSLSFFSHLLFFDLSFLLFSFFFSFNT